MTFQNPDCAFEAAIKTGRLSSDKNAANFAGHYMYMGTDDKDNDLFKHIDTRKYLPSYKPPITAEQIARLRREVKNIQKATDAGSKDFELMAKLHGSLIYSCRYNEVGYIYCDTMIIKDGRTAITEQNMQYYPARVRYYFTKQN